MNRDDCGTACLREVETLLRAYPGEVAAVVVEPLVQGAAGMIVHPEGYLKGLRELTRTYGTLLIADEVAVGFGRTGTMFACEREGVAPDFLCLAKGLTGGYLPLAATLTTDEIHSAFFGRAIDADHLKRGRVIEKAKVANLDGQHEDEERKQRAARRATLDGVWSALPESERQAIQDAVMADNPRLRLAQFPLIHHRLCLDELSKRRG